MFGSFGKPSQVSAWILLVVNQVVMVASIITFAVALWMIASPSSLSSAIDAMGIILLWMLIKNMMSLIQETALLPPSALTVQLGVGLVFLTMFSFFISFMGFYGALSRSQFLLFMYATLNLLVLLLECALVFYFSSNLVEKGQRDQGDQWTHTLRLSFSCCELNITQQEVRIPWSCCGVAGYPDNCTASIVSHDDCYTAFVTWWGRYQTAVYASMAVFHIILSSCSLLRRSSSAPRSHS